MVVRWAWVKTVLGAPPILVYVSGDWDVPGYGILTHGQMGVGQHLDTTFWGVTPHLFGPFR